MALHNFDVLNAETPLERLTNKVRNLEAGAEAYKHWISRLERDLQRVRVRLDMRKRQVRVLTQKLKAVTQEK